MQRNHLFHWIFQTGILAVAGGLIFSAVMKITPSSASSAAPASLVHLRLLDRLDRPEDGYCVDILGTPGNLRVDVPLFAHNCKTSLTDDSAVVLSSDGYIKFPATELCITVAGVNSVALPGTSILLRKCDESISFFNTSNLQRFTLHDDGKLTVAGTELCLAVGPHSAATYSPMHRWRPLFVDDCATVEPARSRWEFVVPPQ